ncbi:MAG TPA: (2Fe-2S)-binding protein [Actinophytocola sp.]|uniref:(2Fe-2S)-binding protein n=1 Tax=Actinophytocola sp. TaxID=1872138 RepID=UPI002DDCA3C0|nr:(2Fe-2S)-binding protein [Actinophytocola sp.]HEV2783711.1 (2Fe-2S)-binding protein [Actinophytocola sp.]
MRIRVNGQEVDVDADRDTALLYVLRNDLGLKASRFGCGVGLCGACFVLLDGQPVASCDTPLWAVAGKDVTTVEGLRAHPLLEALTEEQAAQCGYCISGMIISAAALLARSPRPEEREVRVALERNLCRCGVHNRIVRAVRRVGA